MQRCIQPIVVSMETIVVAKIEHRFLEFIFQVSILLMLLERLLVVGWYDG